MRVRITAWLMAALAVAACTSPAPPKPAQPRLSQLPPPPAASSDNPASDAKAALGRQLFYDPRLSTAGTFSCESCHYRHLGWTDALAVSTRPNGVVNPRHTPTLYNVAYLSKWYWDGRAATLEGQINAAWVNQMVVPDTKVIVDRLAAVPGYASQFQAVFGQPVTPENIVKALAAYIRTVNSGTSPWDRYEMGDKAAVSADAIAGFTVFMGKARCAVCHTPPLYTTGEFYNIGLEADKAKKDAGRGGITKDPKDEGAFKTPTLRSIAISGPYFHDGSAATLEGAVRYMASGGKADPNKSELLVDVKLTDAEVRQLVAFLTALTSDEPAVRPALP